MPVWFVGRSTLDLVYHLDALPDEDTKVFARQFQAQAGGPALNAAIANAQLGGSSVLVSRIGDGLWGQAVKSELGQYGVTFVDLASGRDYQTPLSTVLVNASGSRTIVNAPQAAAASPEIAPLVPGQPPRALLLDGHLIDEVADVIALCQDRGVPICLDGGSWKPQIDWLATALTVAICSERFAILGEPHDPASTIAWFKARGVPHGAITRGARPILGWDGDRRFEIEIERVPVVDTLGAGDVLHGAFCHHFADGAGFEHALRCAAEVATLSVQTAGVRAWNDR